MRATFLALCALLSVDFALQAEPRVAKATAAAAANVSRGIDSVVLRANDVFELRMSGMPLEEANPFSQPYTISGAGTVNILYVGAVQAAGRTPSEVERAIEQALINKKISLANATINVATSLRYVVVGGRVRAPNRLPWTSDLTLNSAIMSVGGADDFGGDKVTLTRGGQITTYRLKELKKDPSRDPKLLPGDAVELL